MSGKADLIYRAILIFLLLVFLAIFYQYSQNGRYSYHKEIETSFSNKYVVDSRSGIIYGQFIGAIGGYNFYKINLKTGEIWINPAKVTDNMPEESKQSPPKLK